MSSAPLDPGEQIASTRGPELEPANLTDLGNARRLVRLFGNRTICHVRPWKKWLVWTGTRWQIDETGEVLRLAKHVVGGLYADAGYELDRDRRKDLARHALNSESVRSIQAMVTLAETEAGIPVLPEQLDRDPWLLNVLNGTLDLRTGTLRPHRREDLITKMIPVVYEDAAPCPTWLRFLDRIFAGRAPLISFVQRALGYSLAGDTREQALFLCSGTGANGKSTLMQTIRSLLVDYAGELASNTLLQRKSDLAMAMNDLATLQGTRFVVTAESDMGRGLAEALVKQLTGGEAIKVKRLYQDLFAIMPTFKLWLATNHKPIIRGTDHAIWRRMRLIPFDVQIPRAEQDPTLLEQLRAERPGILRWLVDGCLAWQREGLGMPEEVQIATETYRAEMDTLGEFLAAHVVKDPMGTVGAAELYDAYKKWVLPEEPITATRFKAQLLERGCHQEELRSGRRWFGIRLRAADELPDGTW